MKKIIRWFSKYRYSIQLAIGAIATCFVFWILFLNRDELILLLHFQLWILVAIIFVFTLMFILDALPLWLTINRISEKSVSMFDWIKIMLMSRMANQLMPTSGGFYKAITLKKDYKLSYTNFVHIYAFYSWLTITMNLSFVALFFLIFKPALQLGVYPATPLITTIFLISLFGPVVVKYIFDVFSPKNIYLFSILEKINGILTTMIRLGRDINFMTVIFILIILKFGLSVFLFQLIFLGMNVEISYTHIALFIAVQQISIIIFITPGNIGIRELLYGIIGGTVGIGVTEGVIASAIVRVISLIVILPFGIAFGGLNLYRSSLSKNKFEEGK